MKRNLLDGFLFIVMVFFAIIAGIEEGCLINSREEVRILTKKLTEADKENERDQAIIEAWKTAAQDWKQKFRDLEKEKKLSRSP